MFVDFACSNVCKPLIGCSVERVSIEAVVCNNFIICKIPQEYAVETVKPQNITFWSSVPVFQRVEIAREFFVISNSGSIFEFNNPIFCRKTDVTWQTT